MSENRLPLKRVELGPPDQFRPPGGGGDPKVFGAVTQDVRKEVAGKVASVASHFKKAFATHPGVPAVARMVLKDEALAKSHRPTQILHDAGCPIVGVGGFGELLVSITPRSLPRLEQVVLNDVSKDSVANISTIETIEPFEVTEAEVDELVALVTASRERFLKLRLFRHVDQAVDNLVKAALLDELKGSRATIEGLSYARGLDIYRIDKLEPDQVRSLGRFIGTQSLGRFPEYHVVRPAAQPLGKLSAIHLPGPEEGVHYPTVGVVDTGVDPRNQLLNPWLAGREVYVDEDERDYEHGTFVAGLVVNAQALNHGDPRFPKAQCRFLDVIAVPGTGRVMEHELLAILREVVPKYPDIRVWNLSLAGSIPCSDHAFSDFAIALDEIQEDHQVTMVLAAGNLVAPFRSWPPSGTVNDTDRICGPADSVRALTVGAIAHRESASSCVRADAPSPFSRRGPGPAWIPKPEITHFGGNCEANGGHAQMGILSVDGSGNLAESIGTSFASPIAAATLAHVQDAPTIGLSSLMAKAMVIHSAALSGVTPSIGELAYRGFGTPTDPADILGCDPWAATLLFETEVSTGIDVQRTPFALPDCLISVGGFKADVTVTLLYEPALDGTFGAEYCRTNVDLSMGTYLLDEDGDRKHARKIDPFPKRATSATEKRLIENGFKWSPVKVYRRRMTKGVKGDMWRLVVAATDRSGAANGKTRVAMVVTISDIERRAQVYNDVVRSMTRLGWQTSDVTLRVNQRLRV